MIETGTTKMDKYGSEPLDSDMEEEFAQAMVINGFVGRKAELRAGYSESDIG